MQVVGIMKHESWVGWVHILNTDGSENTRQLKCFHIDKLI